MHNSALVVVDTLYDFIDGSMACGNAVSAVAQTVKFIASQTKGQGGEEHEILDTFPILFVRDHHPADHSSFKDNGGMWPAHCIAGTHELRFMRTSRHTPMRSLHSTKDATRA